MFVFELTGDIIKSKEYPILSLSYYCMQTHQRISRVLLVFVATVLWVAPVQAATTTLTLAHTVGDTVQVSVAAEATAQIKLSYLPPGAATLSTIIVGTTDSAGKFSTSLSSGGYGIPSGSPVFATVSGVQSPMGLWPTYTSALTLTKTSIQVAVGQKFAIGGSAALILAANSEPSIMTTSVSGSQITITGVGSGSGTVTVCAMNAGCRSIAVEVGAQTGQTQITFSPENPVLTVGQSSTVVVLGGGTNGYSITTNTNSSVVDPSFGGGRRALYLYGNAAGSSTLTICSLETSTNCSNLVVTVLDTVSKSLSFTPNNLTLIPGLTQSSTVSGGPDNNYYISSNTNSGIAQASLVGSVVNVVGGSTAGTATITVCSATVSNRCGTLSVTVNNASAGSSSTTIAFSQNVVTVPSGETTTVTVTGGNNSGYSVSSNSNPSVVTATVNGTSNVINFTGSAMGSSIVSICSTSASTTCASVYVTVTASLPTLVVSPATTTITPGAKVLVSVTGGSSTTTIKSNTNASVVSATLSGNGTGLVLTGGSVPGTSVITVCPTDSITSKCVTLTATLLGSAPLPTVTPTTPSSTPTPLLFRAEGDHRVFVVSGGKKRWIKTEAEFIAAGYKWSDITLTTTAGLTLYPDAVAGSVTVIITGTLQLNVRQSYSVKSAIVGKVNKGQVFTVLEEKGGWYKIQLSAKITGWISGAYATKQ